MAVNKATQDNLTAWKKKLLSKGGYTVPEYDDDEDLAGKNDYESVHRLMVNRGQVKEWGEREKRDVSSYAFSTKNAKGVKPSSAAQRVEAPVFNAGNLPDSFIGPRMQDSSSISRTEKNSPTKSSGIPFAANTGFSMGGKTPVFMNNQLGLNREEAADNRAAATENSAVATSGQAQQKAQEDIAAAKQKEKLTAGEVLKSLGNDVFQGVFGELAHSVYNIGTAIENLGEKYLLGYDDPEEIAGMFQQLRDIQNRDYEARQAQIQSTSEKSGVMEVVNNLIPDTARNLRDLALTLATGGGWAGVTAMGGEEALSQSILKAAQGTSANVQRYIRQALQNPQFYSTVMETIGGSYEEAKEKGASDEQAIISSVLSSIPNALIEVGGGSEEVVREIGSGGFKKGLEGLLELGKSAIEEGTEEILQDTVSNVADTAVWDWEREWYPRDLTDAGEDSVFNAARVLTAAGYAAAGTVLTAGAGGVMRAGANRVMSDTDRVNVGIEVKKEDGGQRLLQIADRSENEAVQRQAKEIRGKLYRGENVSAYSLGRLAEAIGDDVTVDIGSAAREIGTAGNTQQQVLDDISRSSGKAADPDTQQNTGSFVQEYRRTLGENGSKAFHTIAEKVSAEELPLEISAMELNSFGENGQKAIRAGLTRAAQNGESQTAYKNAFTAYYKWGTWGKDITQIDSAFSGSISQSAAYAAYMSGVNDNAAIVARNTANQRKATGKGGLTQGQYNSKMDANTRNYLDAVGRAFRVGIVIDDEGTGYNGRMDAAGNVHIAADTARPAAGVLNHELTHVLRSRSEADYQTYKNVVSSFLNRQSEGAFEQRVEELIDLYAERGQTLTRDEAEEEIVANASEMFLRDKESIDLMVGQNRGVALKILDGIRSIINKLKDIVRGGQIHNKEAQMLSKDMEAFQRAERLWVSALAKSTGDINEEAKAGKAKGIAEARNNSEAFESENVTVLPGSDVTDNGNEVKYNLQTFGETERNKYIRGLVENSVISESEAAELRTNLDNLTAIIDASRDILDYQSSAIRTDAEGNITEDNRTFLPVKPNSDPLYKVSVDFSTLCRKRVLQQSIVEQLQSKLGKALTKEEQLSIRKELVRMRAEGAKIDVACGLCYVEARRLLAGKQAQKFLDNPRKVFDDQLGKKSPETKALVKSEQASRIAAFNEENGTEYTSLKGLEKAGRKDVANEIRKAKQELLQKYSTGGNKELEAARDKGVKMAKEHPEMFLTVENLAKLKQSDPLIYDAFTTFVRNATKSKAQEPRVPWVYGDSKNISEGLLQAMNRENGIRSQSWSDFEIVNILDYMQAVMELSQRGSKLQTYTKVPDFVDLMGKTGAMINLSMIAKGRTGLSVNGELDFDQLEGMKYSDMIRLRKKYADTAGSILVGVNDDHIIKAMQSDYIDYVIPYHASGMSQDMRSRAGILGWENYEKSQEEKYIGSRKGKEKPEAPKFSEWGIPRTGDDISNGLSLMRAMADRYLQLCYEREYTPKFPQFLQQDENGLYHVIPGVSDNYWKLLIDRKMVSTESGKIDGRYIEQQTLKPIFNFNEIKRMTTEALGDTRLQDNAKAAREVVDKYLHGGIDATKETLEAVKNMNDQMIDQAVEAVSEDLLSNKYQFREDEPDSKQKNRVNSQNAQTKEKFSLKDTDKESRKNIEPNGGQPYYNDRSYRGYSKSGALSAYGHAMFADDPDSISVYSGRDDARDRGFYTVMHSDLESIDSLKAAIAEAWDEDAENGMTPSGYDGVTGEEMAEQFDPEDIVDSAGAWDNGELISWAFERGIFDDVPGVKTQDGAIAWDESIIHRANEDSDEGVIGEIKDEKLQIREDDPYDWLDDEGEDYTQDEDAPPETVIKEDLGGDWLDRQVDRTISASENVESTIAALRAEGKAFKNVKPESVKKVVKAAAKQYGAADTAQLNTAVHGALDYLSRHGEEGTGSAVASIYQAVKTSLSKAESVDRTMYEEARGMRDYLRTIKIYIPDSVKKDITDWNDFRKSLFGKVRIVNDPTAMHIDQAYAELSAQYPQLLSSEISNPSAQLQEIADTLDAAQPVIVASYGEDRQTGFIGNINEASIDMTTDILHNLVQTTITQTQDAKLRQQLVRQREKFAEQKKALRQELRNKYKTELISQQTEAKAQAALAQTNFNIEMSQKQNELKAVQAQLKQAQNDLAKARKQSEKDTLKARMTDYRNRMNWLNKWLDEHKKRQEEVAKLNERLAIQKEKANAQLVRQRGRTQERIAAIREANRLSKKNAAERRAVAQVRSKIEKIVLKLGRELEKPTDTHHIPQELRGAVAGFLSTIDFSSDRLNKYGEPTSKTERWRALSEMYKNILSSEDKDGFDGVYMTIDPDAARRIDELIKAGAPERINELTLDQARELYKLVRAVDHMVRYADKVRLEGQMVSATEAARGIIEENQSRMKETRRTLEALNKAEGFFKYDLLDPTRFSDMFGEHFHDLFHNLRVAENTKISHWAEVEEYFGNLAAENGFKESELRKLEEDYKEYIVGNSRIRLSTAQVMSLYLTNKRQQGRSHLYAGGISLPDERKGTKVRENRRSYRITEAEVEAIVGTLSDAQRKLADGMQAFASGQMSNWGNEASMYLYGYKKFTEKNYWPISSDSNYTRSEVSLQQTAAKNASLKNQGMTKALVEKASNPIQIDSAFDVFARHGTQMAAYSAYVGPLEDLNKVINWQTRHDGNWRSVRETLSGVGGAGALRYLNRFIDDVNGQAAGESSPYEGMMGAAKAASIAGNMRVVVQQPTAYWRAMAVIPPKYLLSGIAGHRVDTEEMHSVAPVTRWKEWGYFRDGASGSNLKELMVGKKGVKDRFVDKTMALAGKADDMTWKQLYRAVENWVSADGLERGTEEYRQEVGKRFTDVIDRTQVVDSVFQRTQAMRNNGFGWKMATAFMAEPLKSYNLLVGSFRQIGIAGDKKAAVKGAVMATVGFITSTLINAVVQSAWDVGRDKDPEETRADKFFQALLGDGVYAAIKDGETLGGNAYEVSLALLGGNLQGGLNPLNLIPVVKDVLSFYEGNDVQVMGLSAIADLMTAANNLAGAARGDSKKYTTGYYAVQLVRKLSAATGLPVGNIYREVESLINFTVTTFEEKTGVNASKLRFELDKLYLSPNGSRSVYYNLMYAARRDGNNELAAEVGNFLLESGVSRQTIENALLSRIEKDVALSEVIVGYAEAYQAMDSEKMQAFIDEAEKSGISGDELHRAAMRLIPSDDGEGEETGEAFTADNLGDEVQMTDSYQVEALTNSLLSGDRANADAFNQSLLDAGKEQKEIDSSVKAQLKKRMLESMGYESEKEMQEAGAEFDTGAEEYRYLHDHYGYTQYGYDDLVTAYLSGDGYDAIYRDMLGQHSSGDNVYTAEGMEKELKSRIQQEFNSVYFGGTGSGWEQYRDALKKLGKSWDEILDSYKRSNAGKEWLRK